MTTIYWILIWISYAELRYISVGHTEHMYCIEFDTPDPRPSFRILRWVDSRREPYKKIEPESREQEFVQEFVHPRAVLTVFHDHSLFFLAESQSALQKVTSVTKHKLHGPMKAALVVVTGRHLSSLHIFRREAHPVS